MEIRCLIIVPLLFSLGCASPVKLRTETVKINVPILYCPAPDLEALGRPDVLAIDSITTTTTQGEVAVLYKASMKQLLDYIDRLEKSLNQYNDFNKSYDELVKELELQNTD